MLFQFHIGTIRSFISQVILCQEIIFQFHIGTIRRILTFIGTYCLTTFQFHIGTIRRTQTSGLSLPCVIFQFHIGTIRREEVLGCTVFVCLFQFHIGTIRSAAVPCPGSSPPDFNSTLVQLEEARYSDQWLPKKISIPHWYNQKGVEYYQPAVTRGISIPHWYNQKPTREPHPTGGATFQFHIGTIRRHQCLPVRWRYRKFQFHIGTIRSPASNSFAVTVYYFNSTLVQLEGWVESVVSGKYHISIPHWYNQKHPYCGGQRCEVAFQFHIGTIRRFLNTILCFVLYNFNSTLVQLEARY